MDTTPRRIFQYNVINGRIPDIIERFETPEEIRKRIKDKEEDEKREQYKRDNAQPLLCDVCGGEVCLTYESDLNGSRFYHRECV